MHQYNVHLHVHDLLGSSTATPFIACGEYVMFFLKCQKFLRCADYLPLAHFVKLLL